MKPCYVMPFAFGVDEKGMPDAEAKARLDKAIKIGDDITVSYNSRAPVMFLGAGMPERTKGYGYASLSHSARAYLQSKKWPSQKIVIRAEGYSTLTETVALRKYLKNADIVEIHAVTSWWHLPRVWTVCRIIFGFKMPMKFHASSSPHRRWRLLYDIMREIPALPRSAFMAWRAARKLA